MNAAYQVPAHLHLICGKCTREAGFAGTLEEAETLARRAGWVIGEQVICPKCLGGQRATARDILDELGDV